MAKKILIVDDDKELCQEIADILEDKGFYVDVAFDGNKAKELLAVGKYKAVLLDLKIPEISGLSLLRIAKENRVKARFIVLTGSTLPKRFYGLQETNQVQKKGKFIDIQDLELADKVITKPFDIEALIDAVVSFSG